MLWKKKILRNILSDILCVIYNGITFLQITLSESRPNPRLRSTGLPRIHEVASVTLLLLLVQLAVQITERRVVYIAIMAHYSDAGLVIRLFCNAEPNSLAEQPVCLFLFVHLLVHTATYRIHKILVYSNKLPTFPVSFSTYQTVRL
mgnify:CR=1 FL=1